MKKAASNEAAELEGRARFSIRDIVGDSGKHYGTGVFLDSELLTNLTDEERIEMIKEYVKELGGRTFTAYDSKGAAVLVNIAKSNIKFRNSNGKRIHVNKDLATKFIKNTTKQEAIALIDELIISAQLKKTNPAKYSHGWLDNNGKNNWEKWSVYLQDKENTVWKATLHIATSINGDKYLYDIDPIKRVEQSGNSDTSTTKVIIRDPSQKSNTQNERHSERDYMPEDRGLLLSAAADKGVGRKQLTGNPSSVCCADTFPRGEGYFKKQTPSPEGTPHPSAAQTPSPEGNPSSVCCADTFPRGEGYYKKRRIYMAKATIIQDERAEVFVPKARTGDDANLFVSVNGVNYLLPRGKKSLVPQAVADELRRSADARERQEERIESLLNK